MVQIIAGRAGQIVGDEAEVCLGAFIWVVNKVPVVPLDPEGPGLAQHLIESGNLLGEDVYGAGAVRAGGLETAQQLPSGLLCQVDRLTGDPGQLNVQPGRLFRKFQQIFPVVDKSLGDTGVFPLLPEETVKGQTALGRLGRDVIFPQQLFQGPGGEEEIAGIFPHKQQGVELAQVLMDNAEGQLAVFRRINKDLMVSLFVLFLEVVDLGGEGQRV